MSTMTEPYAVSLWRSSCHYLQSASGAISQEIYVQVVQEGVVKRPEMGLGHRKGEGLPNKGSGGAYCLPFRACIHHNLQIDVRTGLDAQPRNKQNYCTVYTHRLTDRHTYSGRQMDSRCPGTMHTAQDQSKTCKWHRLLSWQQHCVATSWRHCGY